MGVTRISAENFVRTLINMYAVRQMKNLTESCIMLEKCNCYKRELQDEDILLIRCCGSWIAPNSALSTYTSRNMYKIPHEEFL